MAPKNSRSSLGAVISKRSNRLAFHSCMASRILSLWATRVSPGNGANPHDSSDILRREAGIRGNVNRSRSSLYTIWITEAYGDMTRVAENSLGPMLNFHSAISPAFQHQLLVLPITISLLGEITIFLHLSIYCKETKISVPLFLPPWI